MGGDKLASSLLGAFIFLISLVGGARCQSCPYMSGLPSTVCSANSAQTPIPSIILGTKMVSVSCAVALIHAVASLYSYDDAGCEADNSNLVHGSRSLKFLDDAISSFPPDYGRLVRQSNFHATVYCELASKTVILAFRGSASLTPLLDRNQIDDWWNTNLAQHKGERPLQYQYSGDAAWLIEKRWRAGDFDSVCGPGRPNFVLAGYSKGGGQAQYASMRYELPAFVFNSDVVNPAIFTEWLQSPQADLVVEWFRLPRQRIESIR
jgi:hypothetical protein